MKKHQTIQIQEHSAKYLACTKKGKKNKQKQKLSDKRKLKFLSKIMNHSFATKDISG